MSNLEGGRPPRMPKPKPPKVRTKRFSGAKHKFRKTFSTGRSRKIRGTLKNRGVHKSHIKSRRRNPLRRKTLKVRKSELYAAQQKQQYKVAKSQAGLNVASNSMKKRQGSIATTSADLQGAKGRKKALEEDLIGDKNIYKTYKESKKQGLDVSMSKNNMKKLKKTIKKTESNLKRTKKVEKAHEKSLKKDQKQLQKNSKTFDKAEKRLTKSEKTSQAKLEKRLKNYREQVNKQQEKFEKKKQSYQDAVVLTKGKRFFNPTKYRLFSRDARRVRAMRKTAKKLSQSGKYKGMNVDNLMRRNNVMTTAMKSRKKGNFKTYLKNRENGSNQKLIRNSQITIGETKSIINQASSQKQSADDFAKYARLKRKERTNEKRMSNGTEGKRQYELNKGTLGRQGRKYQRSLARKKERNSPETEKNTAVETEISRIQQINKYKKERENDFQQTHDLSVKSSTPIAELRRQHRQKYATKKLITNDNASKYIKGNERRLLANKTETQQQMARLSINGELTKTSDIKNGYDPSKFSSLKEKALRVDFFKARGWDKQKYDEYKELKDKSLSGKPLNTYEQEKYIQFNTDRKKLKDDYHKLFPKSTPSQSP